uniref:(northern house mosquito) hypothetical protein n=1 Tax=Culex pipiens TaxID=7175 RepID=A0A8D8LAU5_CULPI
MVALASSPIPGIVQSIRPTSGTVCPDAEEQSWDRTFQSVCYRTGSPAVANLPNPDFLPSTGIECAAFPQPACCCYLSDAARQIVHFSPHCSGKSPRAVRQLPSHTECPASQRTSVGPHPRCTPDWSLSANPN